MKRGVTSVLVGLGLLFSLMVGCAERVRRASLKRRSLRKGRQTLPTPGNCINESFSNTPIRNGRKKRRRGWRNWRHPTPHDSLGGSAPMTARLSLNFLKVFSAPPPPGFPASFFDCTRDTTEPCCPWSISRRGPAAPRDPWTIGRLKRVPAVMAASFAKLLFPPGRTFEGAGLVPLFANPFGGFGIRVDFKVGIGGHSRELKGVAGIFHLCAWAANPRQESGIWRSLRI